MEFGLSDIADIVYVHEGPVGSRIPFEGIGLVVSALTIVAQSGGNLAETLENIAATLRPRLCLLGCSI